MDPCQHQRPSLLSFDDDGCGKDVCGEETALLKSTIIVWIFGIDDTNSLHANDFVKL
jgi:hypothetical protein